MKREKHNYECLPRQKRGLFLCLSVFICGLPTSCPCLSVFICGLPTSCPCLSVFICGLLTSCPFLSVFSCGLLAGFVGGRLRHDAVSRRVGAADVVAADPGWRRLRRT